MHSLRVRKVYQPLLEERLEARRCRVAEEKERKRRRERAAQQIQIGWRKHR